MRIEEDRWLATRLHRPVYSVRDGFDDAEFERHRAGPGAEAIYQSKLPVGAGEALADLLAKGFRLVSTAVTLVRELEAVPMPADVREFEAGDAAAIREIAASSFRDDRFHADPAIADADADRIKVDWAEACIGGERGEKVLVAIEGGRPVGFLAVIGRADDGRVTRAIDLVAVAPESQGRGVGRRLGEAFVADSAGSCDEVSVGTQLTNRAALRAYEGIGFRFGHAEHDLHLHPEDG